MSLLNVKHLVTPFQNWVHLILILLMAFLFAAYRWAGGRVEIRQLGEPQSIQRTTTTGQARTNTVEVNRARPQEPRGDLLKDFAQRTAPDTTREDTAKNSGSLSDLERQLGLK